jgi:nucleotide-binding universal stress UspA family protein
MEDHIKSVPSFLVDDHKLYEIKANGQFNESLRFAIQSVLKVYNYGTMIKIIVPTDFSEASFNAYNFAHQLVKSLKGVIKLTHIYYPSSVDVQQFTALDEEAEKVHREKLDNLVETLNRDWIGSFLSEPMVEGVFKIGFPGMELESLTKEENTVMVMGTTGLGDAFKRVFGSLSMDMIENSHCPLFLVPPDKTFPAAKELILLSESLKNDASHLLYLGDLCQKLNIHLRIVHLKTDKEDEYDLADAIKILENYFPDLNYIFDVFDTRDVFDSVLKIITESESNIVALSVKKRNFFERIFHKSVTEFAALHSVCPVLILPQEPVVSIEI